MIQENKAGEIKKPDYPIFGYAPGNYQNECAVCSELFIGDKLARQCLDCAIASLQSRLTELEAELEEAKVREQKLLGLLEKEVKKFAEEKAGDSEQVWQQYKLENNLE